MNWTIFISNSGYNILGPLWIVFLFKFSLGTFIKFFSFLIQSPKVDKDILYFIQASFFVFSLENFIILILENILWNLAFFLLFIILDYSSSYTVSLIISKESWSDSSIKRFNIKKLNKLYFFNLFKFAK